MPARSPYRGHLRICGWGVLSNQWVSAIKIPVHEEPNQVIDDREKQGGIDRAEPHRIRIEALAGGGERLPMIATSCVRGDDLEGRVEGEMP